MVKQPHTPTRFISPRSSSNIRSDITSVKRQIDDDDGKAKRLSGSGVREPPRGGALQGPPDGAQQHAGQVRRSHEEGHGGQCGLRYGEGPAGRTLHSDRSRAPSGKPVKPNIRAILFIGFILGLVGGVGAAALKEYSDQSVRTMDALAEATSTFVLAGIPEIVNHEDINLVKKRRLTWVIGIVVVILVGLVIFHFLVMDLDVFWARLMRRLKL